MKKLVLLVLAGSGALLAQAPTIALAVNSSIETSTVLCPGLLATIYGTGFGTGAPSTVTLRVGGQKRDSVPLTVAMPGSSTATATLAVHTR